MTFRAGGLASAHNKTDSAIRITTFSEGIVSHDVRISAAQTKNKERAMQPCSRPNCTTIIMGQKDEGVYASTFVRGHGRGTGDRSERIRTYNFPQGRVTDHRIGFTLYNIDEFMNGDLDKMIEALRIADQTRKLEGSE